MTDYYRILGLSSNATREDIQKRYRYLAHTYHPDRFEGSQHKIQAEEDMKRINEAYAILSNPKKRAQYDRKRVTSSPLSDRYVHQKTDRILGLGAIIVYIVVFGGLMMLFSLISLGLTVLGILFILILSFLVTIPIVFRLDDYLRKW